MRTKTIERKENNSTLTTLKRGLGGFAVLWTGLKFGHVPFATEAAGLIGFPGIAAYAHWRHYVPNDSTGSRTLNTQTDLAEISTQSHAATAPTQHQQVPSQTSVTHTEAHPARYLLPVPESALND